MYISLFINTKEEILKKILLLICVTAITSMAKHLYVPGEFKTISQALTSASVSDTVVVSPGVYKESVVVGPGVTLMGESVLEAKIVGKAKKPTVTLMRGSKIEGLWIAGGTFGVLVEASHTSIKKCRISQAQQSGIMLIAQMPIIEDNVIVFNRGSGITGWDANSTVGHISHNTISHNSAHGINLGGSSSAVILHNIISYHQKKAISLSPESSAKITGNNFYNNQTQGKMADANNMSLPPLFEIPYRLNFALQSKSQCRNATKDAQDIGARISGQFSELKQ